MKDLREYSSAIRLSSLFLLFAFVAIALDFQYRPFLPEIQDRNTKNIDSVIYTERMQGDELTIKCVSMLFSGVTVFEAMNETLHKYPSQRKIRVYWADGSSGWDLGGIVTYDQQKRLLRTQVEYNSHEKYQRFRYVLSNVSPHNIQQFVDIFAHAPKSIGVFSWVSVFEQLGCPIKNREKIYKRYITKAERKSPWPDVNDRIDLKSYLSQHHFKSLPN